MIVCTTPNCEYGDSNLGGRGCISPSQPPGYASVQILLIFWDEYTIQFGMRSDEVDVVAGESLPVAILAAPAKPRIIHHVQMDLGGWWMQVRLGFLEERASAMEGTMRRVAGQGEERKAYY